MYQRIKIFSLFVLTLFAVNFGLTNIVKHLLFQTLRMKMLLFHFLIIQYKEVVKQLLERGIKCMLLVLLYCSEIQLMVIGNIFKLLV